MVPQAGGAGGDVHPEQRRIYVAAPVDGDSDRPFTHLTGSLKYVMCLHNVDTMIAKVRRWGNGLALRVRKRDLQRAGVSEGDVVQVDVKPAPTGGAIALDRLPTFEDEDPRASVRHDRYLYG